MAIIILYNVCFDKDVFVDKYKNNKNNNIFIYKNIDFYFHIKYIHFYSVLHR